MKGFGVVDPHHLRKAFGRFATGVTIITTQAPNAKLEAVTANSFSSVSLDPPLLLWCLGKRARSLQSFLDSGFFAVNVLSAAQSHLSTHFATPSYEKFVGIPYISGHNGCPLLEGAAAQFECRTYDTSELGDHMLFVGEVLQARHYDVDPLVFSHGRYWHVTSIEGDGRADSGSEIPAAGVTSSLDSPGFQAMNGRP